MNGTAAVIIDCRSQKGRHEYNRQTMKQNGKLKLVKKN